MSLSIPVTILTPDSTSFAPSSVAMTVEFVTYCISPIKEVTLLVACFESSASFLISAATTANPFPCSPALAASTAAFNASMFVCSAMSSTTPIVQFVEYIHLIQLSVLL